MFLLFIPSTLNSCEAMPCSAACGSMVAIKPEGATTGLATHAPHLLACTAPCTAREQSNLFPCRKTSQARLAHVLQQGNSAQ